VNIYNRTECRFFAENPENPENPENGILTHRMLIVHVECEAVWLKHQGTAFGQQKSTFLTVLDRFKSIRNVNPTDFKMPF